MGLRVHLKQHRKHVGVDSPGVKRFAKSILRGEDVAEGGLTIVITDNKGIQGFNARFRGMDRPTDVLAFPLHEEDESGIYLGDVIVSLEQARDQAPRFENDFESEFGRLISHGILHLLGYDHHTPSEGKKMKTAERRALSRLEPGTLLVDGENLV